MNLESAPIRVIVTAAYPAVRAGLRALLDAAPGIIVVGEFTTAADSAEIDLGASDVLVAEALDEETLQAIDGLASSTSVVYLAESPAAYHVFEEALPRPRGLLLQGATGEELVAAVRAVAAGLVVVNPAVAAALTHEHAPALRTGFEPVASLTPREQDVLGLVAVGLPNKTIALRLNISEHTVKFHVGAILGKLGAASRTEAVTLAVRSGLLPL